MHGWNVAEFGGTDVMRWVELPDPVPGPGQLRVKVHASGINFAETRMRAGQQDHIDRDIPVEAAHSLVEQAGAGRGIHILAQRRCGGALRRQAVGDEDDLIRRLRHGADRCEGIDQTRAPLGREPRKTIEYLIAPRLIFGRQPLPFSPRKQWRRGGIEPVDLVLGVLGDFRNHPRTDIAGPTPLRGGPLAGFRRVTQADDIDEILIEHTCRAIEQHQNAPTLQCQAGDVAATRRRLARADSLGSRRFNLGSGLKPTGALLQRAHLGLELLDALALGQRLGVVNETFFSLALQFLDELRGT